MAKSVLLDLLSVVAGNEQKKSDTCKRKPIAVTVELVIDGDEFAGWQEFLFEYDDLFDPFHIGGWAECIARHKTRGVLIADPEYVLADSVAERKSLDREAKQSWRKGGALPDGFYAIDHQVALKSFLEGVKIGGAQWLDRDDCNDGDVISKVVQVALFGSERYD